MLIGGVARIIHAFQVKRWGGFFFWLLSGLLYGAAGILTFYNPALAAAALTWFLRLGHPACLVQHAASGVITTLAGIVVALGWPVNTLWLLGRVLAIDLIFQGVAAIAFGLALRADR